MLASCRFSHKEIHSASLSARHELLHSVGVNWNDCPAEQKRGRVILRQSRMQQVSYIHKKTKEQVLEEVEENFWTVDREIPIFTQDRGYLDRLIPVQE